MKNMDKTDNKLIFHVNISSISFMINRWTCSIQYTHIVQNITEADNEKEYKYSNSRLAEMVYGQYR